MIVELDYDYEKLSERFYYDNSSPTGLRSKRKTSKKNVGDSVGFIKTDSSGYSTWVVKIGSKTYTASRVVLVLNGLNIPEKYVDHKDGNPLNNSLSNLRYVDAVQSAHNRKIKETNTSGVPGVYFKKKRQHTYVIATWTSFPVGNIIERCFSVNKYGLLPAFKMACEERQRAIFENNLNGAIYKEE